MFNERRPINLGGTSSAVSLGQALDDVMRQRLERENAKKRDSAATKLQAWWRKISAQKNTRTQSQLLFDADPSTLIALRSLILLPDDVGRMHLWSITMIKDDGTTVQTQSAHFMRLTVFNRVPAFKTTGI
jgi:hypothetical protein